jgi:hypothetical protein
MTVIYLIYIFINNLHHRLSFSKGNISRPYLLVSTNKIQRNALQVL